MIINMVLKDAAESSCQFVLSLYFDKFSFCEQQLAVWSSDPSLLLPGTANVGVSVRLVSLPFAVMNCRDCNIPVICLIDSGGFVNLETGTLGKGGMVDVVIGFRAQTIEITVFWKSMFNFKMSLVEKY